MHTGRCVQNCIIRESVLLKMVPTEKKIAEWSLVHRVNWLLFLIFSVIVKTAEKGRERGRGGRALIKSLKNSMAASPSPLHHLSLSLPLSLVLPCFLKIKACHVLLCNPVLPCTHIPNSVCFSVYFRVTERSLMASKCRGCEHYWPCPDEVDIWRLTFRHDLQC